MDERKRNKLLIAAGVIGAGFLYFLSKASAANASGLTAPTSPPTGGSGTGPIQLLPEGLYTGAAGSSPSGATPIYQSTLPAPTSAQVASQGSIWNGLQPTSFPGTGGYVNFPSGSQAAASLLPWRTDGVNFFTQWAGVVFAVPVTTDAYGNYSAVQA